MQNVVRETWLADALPFRASATGGFSVSTFILFGWEWKRKGFVLNAFVWLREKLLDAKEFRKRLWLPLPELFPGDGIFSLELNFV